MVPLRVLMASNCFKTQFLKFLHLVQSQTLNLSHSGRKLEQNWIPEEIFREREVLPSIHSVVQKSWYYGASESTIGLILLQNTIFEISTLSPIPNLEFKP